MRTAEERVDRLEAVLEEFIKSVGIEFNKLYNSQMRTEAELRDFKDEMRDFKNEMLIFKNETREEHRMMNKKWGEISNKMGTLVEDIISPASRPVIRQYFGCDPVFKSDNILKKKNGEEYEIDILLACEEKVFMIEVKSTPKVNHVDGFLEKAKRFLEFYPEYEGKELILILAGLTFPENVIDYASKMGIYVMAYKEWEYMDILNFDKVQRA